MKSIITSVSPYLCEKIANGDCRMLVKKSAPKEVPFKAYIYATRPKKFYKCGAVRTSDELLWLANGKVEMGDGFKFWADGDEYQCLNGRIIGEFICDKVYKIEPIFSFCDCYSGYDDSSDSSYFEDYSIDSERLKKTCLTRQELYIYGKEETLYGWHISDLKIYGNPKKLSEFRKPLDSVYCSYYRDYCEEGCVGFGSTDYVCNDYWNWEKGLTHPPQSWQYVEELHNE